MKQASLIRRLRYRVEYVFARLLIAAIQAFSLEACRVFAGVAGFLMFEVLRIRRAIILENLRHAFPRRSERELACLGREMWSHLVLMVAEIAHAPRRLHTTNWRQHMSIPGLQPLVRQLLSDRPLVILSGHFGNFELGGYMLGLFGFPTYAVARRLDNPLLDRFVNRFRGATGQYLLDKEGSGGQIAEILADRGRLTLLGDQAAGRKGCWVNFFGRPASTHKAVAVLPLGAVAPMLVLYARRCGHPLQYELGMNGVADPAQPPFSSATVPELTAWFSQRLEEIIRQAPEQYWWVHRRWKGEPPRHFLRHEIERDRSAA